MNQVLDTMQQALGRLTDTSVYCSVNDFVVTQRQQWQEISGLAPCCGVDEQVAIAEHDDGAEIGVYVDESVLERLTAHDPFTLLNDTNMADFCTALEGVSHFQYLIWCIQHHRQVSLLELELQAEVDKYTVAATLLLNQSSRHASRGLHALMFDRVRFIDEPDTASRTRYEQANRHAARFCRYIDEHFLHCRRTKPEAWVAALRHFYRCGHHEKLRRTLM